MSGERAVALATCSEHPDGYPDDLLVVEPLSDLGIDTTFVTWDDASVDWNAFDVVVLRSTWDYPPRRDEFLRWIDRVAGLTTLANPAGAVRWSSDKRYLTHLERMGAPVVPTTFVDPDASAETLASAIRGTASSAERFVVKPSVGAGSVDAGRFESGDVSAVEQAIKHATTLLERGRRVMVQPYLDAIDSAGETALVYIGGEFSHAIRKEPLLAGGPVSFDGLFAEETTSATTATDAQLDAAASVLGAMPFDRAELLYARVDLLPDAAGDPLLLELELVEPSLFMAEAPGAALRFAHAMAAVAGRPTT